MRPSLKKLARILLIVLLVAPVGITIAPKPASAVGAIVLDPTNLVQNTTTAVTAAKQLTAPIFWSLAKAVEQAVVKSLVNWINSGFKGSPAFVTNINNTLQATADAQANSFLKQLSSNGSIKSPFQNQVYQTVSQSYFKSTGSNAYFNQNQYTLNKFTTNDSAFLNGATTQGGLGGWLALVMNPQNNPAGATLLAQSALNSQVSGATNQVLTELNWGQGFMSYRGNCSATAAGSNTVAPATTQAAQLQANPVTAIQVQQNPTLNAPISPNLGGAVGSAITQPTAVTPGTVVSNPTISTVNLNTSGSISNTGSPGITNSSGGGLTLTSNGTLVNSAVPGATTGSAATSLSGSAPCLNQSIQTPGTAIKASLDKALGSGIDTLVSAHDFDEIVNALLGQLINQVIGPNGLLGTSQPSASTGGVPYFDQTTSSQTDINSTLNSTFIQTLQGQVATIQQFQGDWSIINNAAQNAASALAAHACPINQQTLTTEVQPTIDRAAKALSASDYFLNQISTIENSLPNTSDPNATAELAQISTNYSALLATTTPYTLPNSTDISFAQAQSTDTGTTTPPSLYTQMNQIANGAAQACSSGVAPTTGT